MTRWCVQLFELADDFGCRSFLSRCIRCFCFWWRLARHWAEQQSSLFPLVASWGCPGTRRFRAALLLHADRTQRLRSHLIIESCKINRKGSLVRFGTSLITFLEWQWKSNLLCIDTWCIFVHRVMQELDAIRDRFHELHSQSCSRHAPKSLRLILLFLSLILDHPSIPDLVVSCQRAFLLPEFEGEHD